MSDSTRRQTANRRYLCPWTTIIIPSVKQASPPNHLERPEQPTVLSPMLPNAVSYAVLKRRLALQLSAGIPAMSDPVRPTVRHRLLASELAVWMVCPVERHGECI